MSLTSLILKAAAPVPKPEQFRRYLFIGPHPDDIEIGAGATVAKLAAAGKHISFLICMDGRYGLSHAPEGTTPEELIRIREEETRQGAEKLGVTDVHFLRLSDGGFYKPEGLLQGMARVIGETQPEIIFSPDPDTGAECHTDHLNTGNTMKQLAFFAPFPDIMERYGAVSAPVKAAAFYMTARPNRFVKTSGFREAQLKAIQCHKSQFPEGSEDFSQIALYLKIREVAFGLHSF